MKQPLYFRGFILAVLEGTTMRGTEINNFVQLTQCTKRLHKGKNKREKLKMEADLIWKLEEAENISSKAQFYEDF